MIGVSEPDFGRDRTDPGTGPAEQHGGQLQAHAQMVGHRRLSDLGAEASRQQRTPAADAARQFGQPQRPVERTPHPLQRCGDDGVPGGSVAASRQLLAEQGGEAQTGGTAQHRLAAGQVPGQTGEEGMVVAGKPQRTTGTSPRIPGRLQRLILVTLQMGGEDDLQEPLTRATHRHAVQRPRRDGQQVAG